MTPTPSSSFNVRDYGATGNGTTLDTTAFKDAIDSCSSNGGGNVYCPPGRYLLGSIELKSNVTLVLEAGAVLLATTDQSQYTQVDINGFPANGLDYSREHFIWARKATNIGIAGRGSIDGQGKRFFGPPSAESRGFHTVRDWRPMQLIAFIECTDVLLENIALRDAPGWTIWPLGCDNVVIRGITIQNNRLGPNTDGIDPDCCRSVRISDCLIDVGDDCIAVKCGSEKLPFNKPCEDITVTNCVLRTSCCGIRLGYEGDGIIRNCAFSNLVMSETRTGINMLVPRNTSANIFHGPTIENISFSNIIMGVVCPFFIWIGDDAAAPGAIRNLSFSNIQGAAQRASYFGGSRGIPLENISFRNMDFLMTGEMDDEFANEVPYPYRVWDYYNKKGIPHAFYFRHVRDLYAAGFRVRWGEIKGPWLSALRLHEVENGFLSGLSMRGAPGVSAPALDATQTYGVTIQNCRNEDRDSPFMKVDGAPKKLPDISAE